MKYSIKQGIVKAVVSSILFGIPFFIFSFPEYANLSIGGALVLVMNYLKVNYSK